MLSETDVDRSSFDATIDAILATSSAVDKTVVGTIERSSLLRLARHIVVRNVCLGHAFGSESIALFYHQLVAHPRKAIELMNSYIDCGYSDAANLDTHQELPQEILHFSRIVDLAPLESRSTNRRLQKSRRLHLNIKFLSELMILVRSRRKQKLASSRELQIGFGEASLVPTNAANCVLCVYEHAIPHLLEVHATSRKFSRYIHFMHRELLHHLTPLESLLCICSHINLIAEDDHIVIRAVGLRNDQSNFSFAWPRTVESSLTNCNQADRLWGEFINLCFARTPDWIVGTGILSNLALAEYFQSSEMALAAQVRDVQVKCDGLGDQAAIGACVASLAKHLSVLPNELTSIECGHVHLNRRIDIDQEIGCALGKEVIDYYRNDRKVSGISVFPMFDDDHVSVFTTPTEFSTFIGHNLRNGEATVLPESSPIIRSIAVSLVRLQVNKSAARLLARGENLYLVSPSGEFFELFEKYDANGPTGCVLFECALLLYRGNSDYFDMCFSDLFPGEDPHRVAIEILSSTAPPEARSKELVAYYARFASVTEPARLRSAFDPAVKYLMDIPLFPTAHLNILEDYYESQQRKVGRLIELMQLPVRLHTLFFNQHSFKVDIETIY